MSNKSETNRERAVALKYKEADDLPRVVASGAGEIAKRIIKLAKDHDIPVYEDQILTELLSEIDVGKYISPKTYRLVAEVICFLYYVDKKWREEHQSLQPLIEARSLKSI